MVNNIDQAYFPVSVAAINNEGTKELTRDVTQLIDHFASDKYMDDEYAQYMKTIKYLEDNITLLKNQSMPVNNILRSFPVQ